MKCLEAQQGKVMKCKIASLTSHSFVDERDVNIFRETVWLFWPVIDSKIETVDVPALY